MDLSTSATFLAASILTGAGFIVCVAAAIVINNLIYKYWKSFGWKFFPAFVELEEPKVTESKKK